MSLSIDDGVRFGLPSAPQTTERSASLVGMTAAWLDVMEVRLLTGRRLTDADDHTTAVLSYIVALRRREIGVRLAIGAPPSRIITLVIRQALTLVLAGMACALTFGT